MYLTTAKNRYQVNYGGEAISVIDNVEHKEVLYWHVDEWTEEPDLVTTIIEVVRKVYEAPEDLQDIIDSLEYNRNKKI